MWWNIAPTSKVGLGMRHPRLLARVETIKRAIKLWTKDRSIWVHWMRASYIKGRNLEEIEQRPNDSPVWLAILRLRSTIAACADCAADYSIRWSTPDFRPSRANLYSFYRSGSPADPIAIGIWAGQPSKFSIVLWRLRWNKPHCFNRLRTWGESVPDQCLLCGGEDESPGHLFLNCPYTGSVWNRFSVSELLTNTLARISGRSSSDFDTRIGEPFEGMDRFRHKSECWGLHWLAIAAFTWHIWGERNRRLKEGECRASEVVSRELIGR